MANDRRRRFLTALVTTLLGALGRRPLSAQEPVRDFAISARKYAFSPGTIDVRQDDLVRVRLTSEDIPHSFTIDSYRISKRAGSGQSVVFEFRADQAGRFPFYCNLTADPACREMRGVLVVNPR
jgi:heme/copper-type cytochrome/quinol oxidase subunit 2